VLKGAFDGDDLQDARDKASRYRTEFVDLTGYRIGDELLTKIPVELMFRYNFVPLEETPNGKLAIAIADPSQLLMIDEISLLSGRAIVARVSTLRQISAVLKETEAERRKYE